MKTPLRLAVVGLAALGLHCASTPPTELVHARQTYARVSQGPAADDARAELQAARVSLERAERSHAQGQSARETKDLAYVAERRALVAESEARKARLERELASGRARMAREAQLANQAAEAAQRQKLAAQAAAEAERAKAAAQADARARALADERAEQERFAAELQARADEAARRAAQEVQRAKEEAERVALAERQVADTAARLEEERKARELAEQRASQLESERQAAVAAEAQARGELEAEKRRLEEIAAVREEERGLVLTLSGSVLFASGSSELLPSARARLEEVAQALGESKQERTLVIEGHTDAQGAESLNEDLSYRRAESVRAFLTSRGIEGDRIRSEGFGETRPIASNESAEGRANNRRVEIVIERGVGGSGE